MLSLTEYGSARCAQTVPNAGRSLDERARERFVRSAMLPCSCELYEPGPMDASVML